MSDPTSIQIDSSHIAGALTIVAGFAVWLTSISIRVGRILAKLDHVASSSSRVSAHETAISLLDARTRKAGDLPILTPPPSEAA